MDCKARKTDGKFRMECSIRCAIHATPETIWSLLTDTHRIPSWNSTVTSIAGEIAPGQKLALKVPTDPKRTFTPKVTKLVPHHEMEWSDGFAPVFKGVRTYRLTPEGPGITVFTMTETFSGLMLPMIKGSLPDFAPVFETYSRDLKHAAEGEAR
ncbi:MAG: SRPBCC domain-containing protein [Candidatus Eisenbacteria bacterium]